MRVLVFLALRQLWARRLLNGIAVGGVALGVLTLVAMGGMMLGFRHKFLSTMLRISPHVTLFDRELRPLPPLLQRGQTVPVAAEVRHEVPSDREQRIPRPLELCRVIGAMPGVHGASPTVLGSAVLSYGARELPVEVRGIDPARQERVTPLSGYLVAGRWQSFQAGHDGLLVGAGVLERLGAHLGDTVRIGSPRGAPRTLKIVGVFDSGIPPIDNARVYLPLGAAQQTLGRLDTVSRLEVRLDDPDDAPAVAARIEALSGHDAESWQETNANTLGLFKMQNKITGFVIGSLLLVGGFGILAIQIMIVLAKTRDIAILRSVGFRRRDILGVFLLQGALVALFGALLGGGLGFGFCRLLETVRLKMEGFVKTDSFILADGPALYLAGMAFAVVVGLLASLLPALRAGRVEPVDVLRGQIA